MKQTGSARFFLFLIMFQLLGIISLAGASSNHSAIYDNGIKDAAPTTYWYHEYCFYTENEEEGAWEWDSGLIPIDIYNQLCYDLKFYFFSSSGFSDARSKLHDFLFIIFRNLRI